MTDVQLPLLPEVTLKIGWGELLGYHGDVAAEPQRRERWAAWLRLARADGDGWAARYWRDRDGCIDEQGRRCRHLRGAWCTAMGLPCTTNPILTFRYDMIGMACAGAGFEAEEARP